MGVSCGAAQVADTLRHRAGGFVSIPGEVFDNFSTGPILLSTFTRLGVHPNSRENTVKEFHQRKVGLSRKANSSAVLIVPNAK